MKGLNLLELSIVLGEQIKKVINNEKNARMDAVVIASLAKQIIRNADIVLRAERLRSEGVILDSHINQLIIGPEKELLIEGNIHGTNNNKWNYSII